MGKLICSSHHQPARSFPANPGTRRGHVQVPRWAVQIGPQDALQTADEIGNADLLGQKNDGTSRVLKGKWCGINDGIINDITNIHWINDGII